MRRCGLLCGWLTIGLTLVGCEKAAAPSADATHGAKPITTAEELHTALKAKNPDYSGTAQVAANGDSIVAVDLRSSGVVDLSPLAGLPLVEFYAEETPVVDLSPLKGMRIVKMSLNDTSVADIGPLRGMPLTELRLAHTKVRDLSPLRGAPLEQLWVDDAPVTDISPLAGSPLVSLTIKGTKVADIEVVRQLPLLQRLNLGETPVTDLSAVEGRRLTRLIFDPKTVTTGIEAARTLPACQEIGPSLEQMGRPDQFWAAYDMGAFQ